MREAPILCGFLPFLAIGGNGVAHAKLSCYFVSVVNGSCALVILRRDMNATWRTLATLCRDLDWSKQRLIYELQNGLRHRTVPPGHTVDWHDPTAVSSLDVEASTVMILGEVLDMAVGFDSR